MSTAELRENEPDTARDALEVRREAVLDMLARERHALTASLLGVTMLLVTVATMPPSILLSLFMLARIASFVFTRWAATRLEKLIEQRKPLGHAEHVLFAAMVTTGATLALMLWPAPLGATVASAVTLQVVVLVVVTLISVTLAAFPAPRDGMLGSFWLVATGIILAHPERYDQLFIFVATAFVLGVRVYAANAGRHIEAAARTTVENRKLTEELEEALAHAEFLNWRDPLTGLFNRRRLFEERSPESHAANRHLLTIDLDRFKAINDRFGHAAGDHVLIAASDAIRSATAQLADRGEQEAFRLGGEEFLVILEGVDADEANEVAERLRCAIAAVGPSLTAYARLQVTASIGIAEWRRGENLDDALLRSDIACYEAKDKGRNRVRRAA
ncbi:GGDEF domain-containing protein [Qipengyuania soli]|uniref:diguanylate cyclase n=1 Tax=Qipengyuania soli TaxID=2782568 RepID=A0A7S8F227_9SPHN|nr:GGDEF domain-containing protein [Qipengyuania soli]QPC97769.1 GGDEF domain-containing protein [Qipengyuania soli]